MPDIYGWILLLVIVALVIWCIYCCVKSKSSNNSEEYEEGMAPLNWGTFKNNYPRGQCKTGSFKRKSCEIGNCPLGTTVSHRRYCGIIHAQDSDPVKRKKNIARCVKSMECGCD